MRVVSVAQMRDLEQQTFTTGVSEAALQQRAGYAVADAVLSLWDKPGRVLALVGTGNNGRDSWIAAQRLRELGWEAALYVCPGHTIREDELSGFLEVGGQVLWHAESSELGELHKALLASNVILDGLLGIGARGEPREPLRTVIEVLNQVRARHPTQLVVAVDSPTGVDADSGVAAAMAVKADVTIVLGEAKRGLLTPRAALSTGTLIHADIGIVDGPEGAAEVVTRASVQDLLKPRPPDAHKGSFGRLLVVAGSEQYVGAAYLVCAAAIRAGAGIVSLAAPRWLRDVVATRLPEATYLPLPDGGFVREPGESARLVCDRLGQFDALALGPGLSTEGGAGQAVEAVLRARAGLGLPAVVDADGLNALAARPGWPDWIGPEVVLTPHWGELRRLLDESPTDTEAPWELAQKLSAQWPITLVLKGPFTAIGSEGCAWVHPRPNPSLATAGTGDVLTGVIAGLLARGLGPREAAMLGVWAHGEAAARPSKGRPAGGLMASDLLPEIPYALAQAVGTRPPAHSF